MTCRERLKLEHPEKVNENATGGCNLCPITYGYNVPKLCSDCYVIVNDENCTKCWDQEIPEEPTYKHADELLAKVESVTENEEGGIAVRCIRDSGNRTEFPSGAVRDMREGKGRCDLMPLDEVGYLLSSPTICYISEFVRTGDVRELRDALTSSGVFHDIFTLFLEVAKHFEEGAKKYGESNWQKGIPTHCYIDSAVRHYLKWLRGDKDEPHDRAFCWNILCCIWTCNHKPELNTYASKEDADA